WNPFCWFILSNCVHIVDVRVCPRSHKAGPGPQQRSKNMVSAASALGASQLAGRRAVVAMGGMPVGRQIAQGLARQGAQVFDIPAAFASKAQADEAFAHAAREIG